MVTDSKAALRIHLLALPQSTAATIHCLHELFASVGNTWTKVTGEPSSARRIEPQIIGRSTDPVGTAIGIPIHPQCSLEEAGQADVVVVADLDLTDGFPDTTCWDEEINWLRSQYAGGALICSVCTGSTCIAAAGLLDGLEATTHWAAVSFFQEHFPRVRLQPHKMLCVSGPDLRLITSGGPASWEDLALYIITRFSGKREAIRTAKLFVLGNRDEGQLLFSSAYLPKDHEDGIIGDCQSWIEDNYIHPAPVKEMIEISRLPTRTFKRRFKTATGFTPIDYVQTLRIEKAKQMLETSNQPVSEIALAVGYEDVAFFRRLFKRKTGINPKRYRMRFQNIGLGFASEGPSSNGEEELRRAP